MKKFGFFKITAQAFEAQDFLKVLGFLTPIEIFLMKKCVAMESFHVKSTRGLMVTLRFPWNFVIVIHALWNEDPENLSFYLLFPRYSHPQIEPPSENWPRQKFFLFLVPFSESNIVYSNSAYKAVFYIKRWFETKTV